MRTFLCALVTVIHQRQLCAAHGILVHLQILYDRSEQHQFSLVKILANKNKQRSVKIWQRQPTRLTLGSSMMTTAAVKKWSLSRSSCSFNVCSSINARAAGSSSLQECPEASSRSSLDDLWLEADGMLSSYGIGSFRSSRRDVNSGWRYPGTLSRRHSGVNNTNDTRR